MALDSLPVQTLILCCDILVDDDFPMSSHCVVVNAEKNDKNKRKRVYDGAEGRRIQNKNVNQAQFFDL